MTPVLSSLEESQLKLNKINSAKTWQHYADGKIILVSTAIIKEFMLLRTCKPWKRSLKTEKQIHFTKQTTQ